MPVLDAAAAVAGFFYDAKQRLRAICQEAGQGCDRILGDSRCLELDHISNRTPLLGCAAPLSEKRR